MFCGKILQFILLILLISLLLSGCVSNLVGGPSLSHEETQKNIIVGQTTKEQVRAKYGEPDSIGREKSGEVWVYRNKPSSAGDIVTSTASTAATVATSQAAVHAGAATMKAGGGVIGGVAASQATLQVGEAATQSALQKSSNEATRLTIIFSKEGVVKKYSLN